MCPRGEIGRHNGLKIRAFLECQFESGRGHQKDVTNLIQFINIFYDKN